MTMVRLDLAGITSLELDLPRVPVVGDSIQHEDHTYDVVRVVFNTCGEETQVFARSGYVYP